MRHRKSGRKFGRETAHRKALMNNLVAALVREGRIETTVAKAKELRGVAERTINWGVKSVELTQKDASSLSAYEKAKLFHNRRMAGRVLKEASLLQKLFDDVAPQLQGRPGGYTRVMKSRIRRGDAAPMALIELVSRSA